VADKISKKARSRNMAAIRGKDTKPEIAVRRLAHGMGYRYRLHRKDLPGSPDLVFPSRLKVIFVHGCFWHRHHLCKDGRWEPKSRVEFWQEKFAKNKKRDQRNRRDLRKLGWEYLVLWECQIEGWDQQRLETRIVNFLG